MIKYLLQRYGKVIAAILGGALILLLQSNDFTWAGIGAAIGTAVAVYFAPYTKKVEQVSSDTNTVPTSPSTHPINGD